MASELRVPVEALSAGTLELRSEEARYVVKVHRKRAGDRIVLFDPHAGLQAHATLVSDRLPKIVVEVKEPVLAPTHNMPVTLLQALGKRDKPEQAVRDATAFGAERLLFVETDRTVSRGASEKGDRLTRIATQVARQCKRGDLPHISGPLGFEESLEAAKPAGGGTLLVCGFGTESQPLLAALREGDFPRTPAVILIGPEGGLSDDEMARAAGAGFGLVSLGPYVLRMETACSAVLATLRAVASA